MLVYSDLQQSIAVEREGNSLAVNRRVVGSSPTSGANQINNLATLLRVLKRRNSFVFGVPSRSLPNIVLLAGRIVRTHQPELAPFQSPLPLCTDKSIYRSLRNGVT